MESGRQKKLLRKFKEDRQDLVVIEDLHADLLIERKVIAELKAVSHILPEHKAQVINYLKATEIEAGLLINFGKPKLEYFRLHK